MFLLNLGNTQNLHRICLEFAYVSTRFFHTDISQMKGVFPLSKTFLLDTGILLSSPQAILNFDEHDVCVTYGTICELDDARKIPGETGANAREALRQISDHTSKKLPGGGKLTVLGRNQYLQFDGEREIVKAYNFLKSSVKGSIRMVSNTATTKILGSLHGINVESYLTEQVVAPMEQYRGRADIYATADFIDELRTKKALSVQKGQFGEDTALVENEFLVIHNVSNPSSTILAMYRGGDIHLLPAYENVYGISPRKVGQRFALAALMAPVEKIPLVILKGPAGTAKTFLSMAAGLQQTLNDHIYDRILVSRPNVKFDSDIGYLKGTEEEKIGPLIRPVMDNLELLCRTSEPSRKGNNPMNNYVQDLFNNGVIIAQAMAYMRGRSVANTYIVIDEAQNMSPLQAFGIISRVGVGSKVIIAGDPEQIDNPELDRRNNGLVYASEKMRGSSCCAQITFSPEECVRSALALEAIQRMNTKIQL